MLSFALLTRLLIAGGYVPAGPAVASITSATQTEGTSLVHTVTLASAVTGVPATYPFSISAVTASTPSDYTTTPTFSNGVTLAGNTLTVPLAVTSFTVTVATSQDTVYEGAETYTITVGGMSNTGTINDDDSAPAIASVSSASAVEGTAIVHTVAITGTAQAARTFALSLSGGTATGGGTDYTSTLTNGAFSAGVTISAGNISVPPGVTSFSVSVPTATDALTEGNETYTLTVGGASGTGTILDGNEGTESFTLTISSVSANAALGTAVGTGTITRYTPPTTMLAAIAAALAGNGTTGTGGITASAVASRSSGTAPCAVFFDATGTTNTLGIESFHEIWYFWNFGDGETAWVNGTGVGDNSKNRARGAVAPHVYETPGTYYPRLWTATRSISGVVSLGATVSLPPVVVADANAAYPTTATICVSPSGDFSGAPTGSIHRTTASMTTALGTVVADTRYLFRGSETVSIDGQIGLTKANLKFGSFGTGKPRFTFSAADSGIVLLDGANDCSGFIWENASFDGVSTDASGVRYKMPLSSSTFAGTLSNVLMHKCEAYRTGGLFAISFSNNVFVSECNVHDSTGGGGHVGFYTEFCNNVALLGSAIVDAFGIEHNTRHHSRKIVISNNTFRQAGGANGGGKQLVTCRGMSQTYSGHNELWYGTWAEHIIVSDNTFDGGASGTGNSVQFAPTNTGTFEKIRDVICERNLWTGNTGGISSEVSDRITIRNNLYSSTQDQLYGGPSIQLVSQNTVGAPASSSTWIYNNTIYVTTTHDYSAIGIVKNNTPPIDYATGTVIKNNLIYAPNATADGANSGSSPTVLYTPASSDHYTLANNTTDGQIKATVPGFTVPPTSTLTTWTPTSGYGIGAGDYVPVFDDFFGEARALTFDFGAVNP